MSPEQSTRTNNKRREKLEKEAEKNKRTTKHLRQEMVITQNSDGVARERLSL